MTTDELEAAGYRKFHDPSKSHLGDWYRGSYQRRVVDEHGVRYFITITHSVAAINDIETVFFTPSNQFTTKAGTVFNVEMLVHNETIVEVEAFFDNLWRTMRLEYYERTSSLTDDILSDLKPLV